MSYKFETKKIHMPADADKRIKLTPADKEDIVHLYKKGGISTYKLAEKFKVSRRSIQFILDPEKLIVNRQRLKERGGAKIYYDKDKNRETMRKHRHYKQDVLKRRGLV